MLCMSIVINGEHLMASRLDRCLKLCSEAVTVKHYPGRFRRFCQCDCFSGVHTAAGHSRDWERRVTSNRAYARLKAGRDFSGSKPRLATRILACLRKRQRAHDMPGTHLRACVGAEESDEGTHQVRRRKPECATGPSSACSMESSRIKREI